MNDKFKKMYLKNDFKLVLPPLSEESTDRTMELAMTVAANFATHNIILPTGMVSKLSFAKEDDIVNFYKFYEPIIKDMVGSEFKDRRMFYPNFPDEVIGKDMENIFFDQLNYAFSGFSMMPESTPEMTYFPYIGKGTQKKVYEGSEEDFKEYIKSLLKKTVTWTPKEIKDIKLLSREYSAFTDCIPEDIGKNKENNITLYNIIKRDHPTLQFALGKKILKNPTDVLRYAVSLVGGDISLNGKMKEPVTVGWRTKTPGFSFSKNPKYPDNTRNLTKTEIKEILTLLENTRMDIGNDYKDLLKDIKENATKDGRSNDVVLVDDAIKTYESYYKSLAKVAHINPTKNKSQVSKVLDAVCKNKTRTIMSLIENSIKENDLESAIKYLKYRPTEFSRRLDTLIDIAVKTKKEDILLDEYKAIINKSSVSSLLQLKQHFEQRKEDGKERVINVNGVRTIKEGKPALDNAFCNKVISLIMDALKEKYKDTPYLGKIYISEDMKDIKIPKNNHQQTAQETLFNYTFGSTIPSNGEEMKQIAVKWEDGSKSYNHSRVDLDLSATMFDKKGNAHSVGWNSDYANNGIVYSGDIQQGGSAEFLNFDLKKLREAGIKGVAANINLYCGAASFNDLLITPQVMLSERRGTQFGKVFEEKTVKQTINLNANSKQVTPLVLDVDAGKWIWLDAISNEKESTNVATTNIKNTEEMVKEALFAKDAIPGFDILLKSLNADIVEDIKEADIVFSQQKVNETLLKKGATNITQNDYNKLVELIDETRTAKNVEIEK